MREGKRWNLLTGPPRFVAALFEPPIRNFESGRSPSGREIGGKNPEKRKKVVSACRAAVEFQKPPQTWHFLGLVFLHNSAVECSRGRSFFFLLKLADFPPSLLGLGAGPDLPPVWEAQIMSQISVNKFLRRAYGIGAVHPIIGGKKRSQCVD